MKTFGSMECLWLYLQSLPKNSKEWLLEKLTEDLAVEENKTTRREKCSADIECSLK